MSLQRSFDYVRADSCFLTRWRRPAFHIIYERIGQFILRFVEMSASDSGSGKDVPKDYRSPGLRGVKTTSLFRAVNPELFIKPNKPVMAFGLVTVTLCVGYLGYLHAVKENTQELYEAVDSEGERYMRRKNSKWD
ncbi:small integral membrane protein 8 isoform X2 [Brachyhypopomus gauderio]